MSLEYNALLISKLYSETNQKKLTDILGEMEEIKDPYFVLPIQDGYLRNSRATYSHYFLSALESLPESNSSLEFTLAILDDVTTPEKDIPYALRILLKKRHSEKNICDRCFQMLEKINDEAKSEQIDSTYGEIRTYLAYIDLCEKLSECSDLLREMFLNENIDKEDRSTILNFLLKDSQKKDTLRWILEITAELKDSSAEIIVVKKLLTWKGRVVDEILKKIAANGGGRAKEIIITKKKQEEVEIEQDEQAASEKQNETYSNAEIVFEISNLLDEINQLACINPKLGKKIFIIPNFSGQSKTVSSKEELVFSAANLRALIAGMNDASLSDHGLSQEEEKTFLPGVPSQDRGKSFNALFLYLKAKGFNVEIDLFGVRNVWRAINLMEHPNRLEDIAAVLGPMGASELFAREEWGKIHKAFLNEYKKYLLALKTILVV